MRFFEEILLLLKNLAEKWNRFWFFSPCELQIKSFRMMFGAVLLCTYLARTADLSLFYHPEGLTTWALLPDVISTKFRFSILEIFPSFTMVCVFHALLLISLITLTVGIFPA